MNVVDMVDRISDKTRGYVAESDRISRDLNLVA